MYEPMIDEVLVDIDRAPMEDAPRKRIKPHLREQPLRDAAQKHGAKLDQVMAIACYRAEEIRAGEAKREEAYAKELRKQSRLRPHYGRHRWLRCRLCA